ncbi:hypothetical protein VTK73DRAFT_7123 [Phialemonium thermophilum]|uniref:F-box domain-containing protein n=1 Tax=Phialemonium thermophilum TaxID=223376 RepID=A0ABR3WGQ6_9PEZI
MALSPHKFYCLWQKEAIAERLFELLSNEDICSVRLANSACCNLVTRSLFKRTYLTFTPNTFTKPSRIQALSRVGHHIEHLTFHFAHSDATFLPPLIHPVTGCEITFLYTPHTSMASVLTRPKYGNSCLGDILTQQYPPLFHAATNVPSFINAMKHLPNLRHLTIKTPGQDPKERYRRDIVDYALISLRISLERTNLPKLTKLSFSAVHPSAFNYLRPVPGFGSLPSSTRRWRQIRKLYIAVESWDFYGPAPGLDHLKIIDDYIRLFAPALEKFTFTWLGRRGPCPLALSADPLFAPPRSCKKLFAEVTSPMSPLPARPSRRPIRLPRLRYLHVRNATMTVPQVRVLVDDHKSSLRGLDFDNVALIDGGSWDDALAPLSEGRMAGIWSRRSMDGDERGFRPSKSSSPPPLVRSVSGSAVVASDDGQQLPDSSPAAEAASRELFEVDLDGVVFGGANDVENCEIDVENWACGVVDATHHNTPSERPVDPVAETDEGETPEEEEGETGSAEDVEVVEDDLPSDIEAAKQASVGFDMKLKKQRVRKKKSHHRNHHHYQVTAAVAGERRNARRQESRSHHKEPHNDENRNGDRSKQRSRSRHPPNRGRRKGLRSNESVPHSRRKHHRDQSQRRHRKRSEPELPSMPECFIQDVLSSDDEAAVPLNCRSPKPPGSGTNISAPILNSDAFPVLLQPKVYDPSATTGPFVDNKLVSQHLPPRRLSSSPPPLMPSLTRTPSNKSQESSWSMNPPTPVENLDTDNDLTAVQQRIELELLLQAEQEEQEEAARSSALRRAKEAVLTKLSLEFCKRQPPVRRACKMDSAAVSSLNLSTGVVGDAGKGGGGGGSAGFGRRLGSNLRDGLFGRAGTSAPRSDYRSLDSQSALVPLFFSRS